MTATTAIEAACLPRLLACLDEPRQDQQGLALAIHTRLSPDCLADGYGERSEAYVGSMHSEHSRQRAFGMPFARWKAQHRCAATPRQVLAFEAAQARHG